MGDGLSSHRGLGLALCCVCRASLTRKRSGNVVGRVTEGPSRQQLSFAGDGERASCLAWPGLPVALSCL